MIAGYGKIYGIDDDRSGLVAGMPVVVQEKYDGSQVAWGVVDGALCVRSRHGSLDLAQPPPLYVATCDTLRASAWEEGYTYYGEALRGKRHNRLAYDRAPRGNVVLWDVWSEVFGYLPRTNFALLPGANVVEHAQVLWEGPYDRAHVLRLATTSESSLGGRLEGVVVKSLDGGARGKWVNADFRETAVVRQPRADAVSTVVTELATDARFDKAAQRLVERNELRGSVEDIPALLREVARDYDEEAVCREVAQRLYALHERDVRSRLAAAAARWYRARLEAA